VRTDHPKVYQRACDLISGQASNGPFGSPVFACAGKTDSPSRLILSQTSAGNGLWGYVIAGFLSVQFLCSCREAVPSSRPALVPGAAHRGRQGWPSRLALTTPSTVPRSSESGHHLTCLINRLRAFLADPGAILDAVDNESHSVSGCSQLIERDRQVAEELGAHAPDKVKAALITLLCGVEIKSDRVDITLSRCRLTELLAGPRRLCLQSALRSQGEFQSS
jgi:hypothetical protein